MLTETQKTAVKLLTENDNVLLYGGSRSGKTYVSLDFILFRCWTDPGSEHLVTRLHAVDIRASVWKQTLPKVLKDHGLHEGVDYRTNEQLMEIVFSNKSRLVCAGLDDKERVDKILGQEYSCIYINESQDVNYQTIKTIRTRLSQKTIKPQRFIVDLNPTSINHWTYKMFILKVDPETGKPHASHYELGGKKFSITYASLQMNAEGNRDNLAPGYIESILQALSGMARNRFYLGEYSNQLDLLVFNPGHRYQWSEFLAWGENNWSEVRLIGGLDLGFQDADAFCICAYIPGKKDVWIVYEHKDRRQSITELSDAIKKGMHWVWLNVPTPQKTFTIFADNSTIRHGKEGDSKKSAIELRDSFGLPIEKANKRHKGMSIDILQEEVNSGRTHVPINGAFDTEATQTIWTKRDDGVIERVIDDETFHPDSMDCVLYAHNEIRRINQAFAEPEIQADLGPVRTAEIDRLLETLPTSDDKYW